MPARPLLLVGLALVSILLLGARTSPCPKRCGSGAAVAVTAPTSVRTDAGAPRVPVTADDLEHEALLRALRHTAEPVRRDALAALAIRGATDRRALAALRHAADTDPSAALRAFARRALEP